jgi:hypothetical protein
LFMNLHNFEIKVRNDKCKKCKDRTLTKINLMLQIAGYRLPVCVVSVPGIG